MRTEAPELTLPYRPRRRRAQESLRDRLRLLGDLGRDIVVHGTGRSDLGSELRSGRLASLERYFADHQLDRVRTITESLQQIHKGNEIPGSLFRPLVQAIHLGALARGSGPLPVLEPMLRSTLAPDERGVLKGRVLVPLEPLGKNEQMVADAVDGRVMWLPAAAGASDRVLLAARVFVEEEGPVPRIRLSGVKPGVPIGPGSDRKLLARCRSSLVAIAAGWWTAGCRPFPSVPEPQWIGPVTVLRSPGPAGGYRVEDPRGRQAHLDVPEGVLGDLDVDHVQYLLAYSGSCRGELVLAPVVVWSGRGRRQAARIAHFSTRAMFQQELEDPLLLDVTRKLTALVGQGLSRGGSLEASLAPLAHHLVEGGHRTLAALLLRLAGGGASAAGALALAGHLAARSRSAVRWFELEPSRRAVS